MSATKDLTIRKGATFAQTLRWEAPPIVWKPITAISLTAPVRLRVPAHGCPPNWRVNVSCNKSMREIDGAKGVATVIDADTIEFNTVNTADSPVYKGGGYVQRLSILPVDGIKARMAVKDKIGGTEHLRLTTETGEITCDTANRRITFTLTDEQTAAMHAKCRVADLELIGSDGQVFKTVEFEFQIIGEVAT